MADLLCLAKEKAIDNAKAMLGNTRALKALGAAGPGVGHAAHPQSGRLGGGAGRRVVIGGEDVDLVDDSVKKLEDYAGRLGDLLSGAHSLSWADRDLASGDGMPTRTRGLQQFFSEVTRLATGGAS